MDLSANSPVSIPLNQKPVVNLVQETIEDWTSRGEPQRVQQDPSFSSRESHNGNCSGRVQYSYPQRLSKCKPSCHPKSHKICAQTRTEMRNGYRKEELCGACTLTWALLRKTSPACVKSRHLMTATNALKHDNKLMTTWWRHGPHKGRHAPRGIEGGVHRMSSLSVSLCSGRIPSHAFPRSDKAQWHSKRRELLSHQHLHMFQ